MYWFNRFRDFIAPTMGVDARQRQFLGNNVVPRGLARGWIASQQRAPRKFRSTGMMPTQYQGGLITAQAVLRGVLPLDAAALEAARLRATRVE
jgi:hypothetical protein